MVNGATTLPVIPLDPTKWVEPVEKVIAKLVECRYTDTDQSKTSDQYGNVTFTEYLHLPRPKRQWKVVIELLDRVYVNKLTGEKSPVRRYMTIDLERYDDQKQVWTAMPKGNNKSFFTLSKWADKRIVLHPDPAVNEGMVAEFEYLRSKMFGGTTAAKDIIYPIQVLALPGKPYEYRGEVLEIEFTPKDDADSQSSLDDMAGAAMQGAQTSGPATMLDKDQVIQMLAAEGITDGSDENSVAINEFVKNHKAELPAALKTGLVTGEFWS